VPRASSGSTYGATLLRYGLDHHRDKLSDDFAAVAELYIEKTAALHALWQHGPSTVIHGDTHIGNLFDDHGRTGFLDWGIINVSTPMRDVSYFLNMAMAIEDRRAYDRELIRHYLDCRNAHGGATISFDDAWHAHRVHAAYTVPASCQVVTFPDDATPRRRVFAAAFLARAEAALADLEVKNVLRAAGL
jgi:aminoglycoside phosphotransferase (APT) family kinase protein